jgi:hypothetical protein
MPVRAKALGYGLGVLKQFPVAFIAQQAVQPGQQDQAVFQFGVLLEAVGRNSASHF